MRSHTRLLPLALALAALSPAAAAGSTARFRLSSPADHSKLQPGAIVPWSLSVALSADDNEGLALALVDLVQEEGHPAEIALPSAGGAPGGLAHFDVPQGFANPGSGALPGGFGGSQIQVPGQGFLLQIGGAQNTFGTPGNLMGKQSNVLTGVARGKEILLAQGSFEAPHASGTYRLSLANAIANTLVRREAATGHWRVEAALAVVDSGSISFTVETGAPELFVRADTNLDGTVNISDASTILGHLFLGSPASLGCQAAADVDGNGSVSLTDAIFLLNHLFLGGQPPAAPYPTCGQSPRPQPGCEDGGPCS